MFVNILFLCGWLILQSNCQITFLVAPSDITVAVGSPALFNCSVSSTASASISWQKDGRTISPTPTKFAFLPNNSLLVNPTETGDDGTYSCVVTDTASSQSFSRNASLVFAFILNNFLFEPSSQTVDEGAVVYLFCLHGGSVPPADISWTLNGTTLSPSSRVDIRSSVLLQTSPPQVTSTLTITSARRTTDMGAVRCVATNPLLPASPVTSGAGTLSIRALPAPPSITSDPVGVIVSDGTMASLSCSATGEPSPNISWLLNGSPVALGDGVTVERRDSTSELTVASATIADAGNYSCVATNSEGSATSSTSQLQIATLESSFTSEPMDLTALIRQTAVLDCRPPFSIPPAVLSWSRNSVPINSSRHQILESGSLSISMVELGDAGDYACTATNNFLSTSVTSNGGSLSVIGIPEVSPPVISAAVGQTAIFTCNAVGIPPPSVRWLKGANEIVSGVNPRVTISGSSLTIADVVVQDGSYYTCSTSLFSLVTMSQALLTVLAPPSFTSLVTNVTAILSNSVSLPCSTLPDPGLNFSWYFGNVLLSPETSGGSLAVSNTGVLTISSVVRSNEGMYTCMAVNNLGAANGTVYLEVFVPSSITAVLSTVTAVQGSSAMLQCMAEGNPVPVQTWTRNGALVSGSRVLVSEEGRTLTISNSREEDEGTYICHARNVAGNASAEVVLEIQVAPAVVVTPITLTLNAGATATFTCMATGDPTPQIQWQTGGGTNITSLTDPRYQLVPQSGGGVSLTISNLQGSDNQQFTCQGGNVVSVATATVSLTVLVPPGVNLLPQTTGVQGRALTILCGQTGQPIPTVTWLRGSEVVQTNSRVTVDAQGSLVFSPVFSTDGSTYTCLATNILGNASATTTLTIQVAPVIQVVMPTVTANAGSTAVLDCASSGNPIPTVTWSFNSAPVLPAGMPRIQQAANNSLLISQVQTGDEGRYLCQATNIAGTESATVELIVHVAPTIQAETSEVTAIAGSSATLRCTASGDPAPSQTWTRNGATITNSRFVIQAGGSELLVQNVMETDQGEYQCMASNSAGSANVMVNLNVISIPVVALPLTSVAVTEGQTVALDCQASGDPIPTVAWFYNSIQVPNSETLRIRQAANSSLIFTPVQSTDRGLYVCQATNAAGQDSASLQLTVYVTPTITAEQNSLTSVRGTSVTMTCFATGDPAPVLTWTRNGVAVSGPRFQISSDGRSLTVTTVEVEDEGVYICSATNPAATRTDTVSLNVIVPPEFIVLTNSTAVENQQHSMTCLARGDPTPTVVWRYNGQVVSSQQGMVTFNPVLRENAGVYTCTASNAAGTISSDIILDVQYIPRIITGPQDASIAVGARADFTCQAEGNPIPQISWLFNNSLISGAQSSTYVIAMVTASNAGQYTCLSSNGIGIASATAALTVLFPPSSPALLSAIATSSNIITLGWSASSSNGGSPITSHIVEYRDSNSPSASFENRTFPAAALSVELGGLNPFTTYEVRVRANNIAGLSTPSNSLTTRTHPAAPSSPSGFTVASSTATSVSLRWGMPETLNGMFAAYEIRYGRDDSFSSSVQERLLFTSMFTIAGLEMGVSYRMEVRASTISLIGETLWGPFAVLLVRDGVELEVPTTLPTTPPSTMTTSEPVSTTEVPSTPPSTQTPDTEEPSSTEPQSTETPETPPSTEPISTNPPTTDPPSTDPPTSEPPITPSSEPPPTDPFTTEESTSESPSTLPPETMPPPTVPLNPPVVVPSGLTALIPPGSLDQILLYWREPTMQGSFIGYHVIVTPPPPPHVLTPIRVPYSPISSTYILEGLAGFTEYNITVTTFNDDGLGPQTEFVVITTPENVPAAPRSLQVIRVGSSGSVFASWLPPDQLNGILTRYMVRVLVNSTRQEVTSRTIDITPSSHETEAIIDDLDLDNILYEVQVSASTSAGEGPAAEFFIGMDTGTPGTPPSSPPTDPVTSSPSSVSTDDISSTESRISSDNTSSFTEIIELDSRDGTYYTIRIVPPIVGALVIVALVMGIVWCCLYFRSVRRRKTKQYEVADYQINLKDIPEVEEQVDFAAEYDKHFVKEAFDSNVSYNPHGKESPADSGSEPDERTSDQEVLIPFSTAVGRDAVQETEDSHDEFHQQNTKKQHSNGKHREKTGPQPSQMGAQQPYNTALQQGYYPQGPFVNGGDQDSQFHPAYGMSSGGIMETRIGAVGNTRSDTSSGADIY